jgi:UDP-GlcNAc:undecaprenyl-phosphate GlcNAc-1-phosphate transferase
LPIYFLAFGVSLAMSLALTPLVRRLAYRVGAVVMPHDRKVHERPTPTMGGLAIFLAVTLSVLACMLALKALRWGFPRGMWQALCTPETLGIFVSSLMILALGAWDDLRELSPMTKLVGQVVAVLTMISFGVEIRSVSFIRGSTIDLSGSPLASLLLTLLWMVAFINIINLIDGLDGLAAGVVLISSLAFLAYGSLSEQGQSLLQAMLIAAALGGATLGFLFYNFNPASIFMGDSGALFLGFTLGALSIQGILKRAAVATLFPPLIILAVPIADTVLAIVRRMRGRRPVHHADKEHIHHRLLYLGHSQKQAVLLIYLWTGLLTAVALTLEFSSSKLIFLLLLLITTASLLLSVLPRFLKARRQEDYLRDLAEEEGLSAGEAGCSEEPCS